MSTKIYFSLFTFIFCINAYSYEYNYIEEGEVYQTKSQRYRTNTRNTTEYVPQPALVSTKAEKTLQSAFSYYPYLGLQIGKVTGELEHDNNLSFPLYSTDFSITNKRESSLHGMSIGATLGYALSYKNFYSAIEAFYTDYQKNDSDFLYDNAQASRPSQSNPNTKTTYTVNATGKDQLNSSYGVNLKLGYFIRYDFVPYITIGYSKSNYTSKVTGADPLTNHGHEFLLAKFDNDFSHLV